MIRRVNVCQVGQIQSGTSQQTGNQWRKQEYVVEWHENETDTQTQKIVMSVMNDNIEKLNVQVGDKLEIRFDLRSREYNGRYYQDVYSPFDAIRKLGTLGGEQEAAMTQQPMHGAIGQALEPKSQTVYPPQHQGNGKQQRDDLPF